MIEWTEFERKEALRAILSAQSKSEKALTKLKPGTFPHKLTERGIHAYRIAAALLEGAPERDYSPEELADGRAFFTSAIARIEQVLPKFRPGTPQHTLAVRRIRAFEIGIALLSGKR